VRPYDPQTQLLGEAWARRYQGVAPFGAIARARAELMDAGVDFEEIVVAWDAYLTATQASFASPTRFANTYGQWVPLPTVPAYVAPPAPQAPDVPHRPLPAGRLRQMADDMAKDGTLKRVAPVHTSSREDFVRDHPAAAPIVEALDLEPY